MTQDEKDAILGYLEFNLTNLIERLEPHINVDNIGPLYDEAYQILYEMERTLDDHIKMQEIQRLPK